LAKYITWPEESRIDDKSKPFILGVIGKSKINTWLEKLYPPKNIQDKKVEIKYFSSPAEIKGCHILFIGKCSKQRFTEIQSVTAGKPILTVADTSSYAQKGVHINFFVIKSKYVRFELNETALFKSPFGEDCAAYRLTKSAKIINPWRKRDDKR
jgi:hypothetical protein